MGSLFEDFEDGLNWTPVERFQGREGAGWDVTVPATCFRAVDEAVVGRVVDYLNTIKGRPFFGEDCIKFIERAFGGQRLFGDSPTGMALGIGLRVADPALPLLRRDAELEPRAAYLLRAGNGAGAARPADRLRCAERAFLAGADRRVVRGRSGLERALPAHPTRASPALVGTLVIRASNR